MRLIRYSKLLVLIVAVGLTASGCVYYNTFFMARQKFKEAEESQRKNREQQKQPQGRGKQFGRQGAQAGRPGQKRPQGKLSKVSPQEKLLYQEAIKKASKVLKLHPNSRWVDDALWLIGKSYYNMGDYFLADRKFKELVVNHPKSKFWDDSYYYMGLSQMKLGHYEQALSAFAEIERAPKKSSYIDDVCFAKGAMALSQNDYDNALDFFSEYVEKYSGADSAAQAMFNIGLCYEQLGDYLAAYQAYSKVRKYNPSRELYFDAALGWASAALAADSVSLGMKILRKLAKNERYFSRSAEIRLKIAEGYYLQGKVDEAIKEYTDITVQSPKTRESAEAYYRLGILYQDEKFDLESAKDAFSKAKTEYPRSEFRNLALARSAQIAKLESYQAELQRADSLERAEQLREEEKSPFPDSGSSSTDSLREGLVSDTLQPVGPWPQPDTIAVSDSASLADTSAGGVAMDTLVAADSLSQARQDSLRKALIEKGIEARFLLAELYAFELNRPDSALHEYILIADEYPRSPFAPRSLLAAANIEFDRGDSVAARGYLQRLLSEHPQSPQAVEAAQILDVPFNLATNAVGLYAAAESLVFQADKPDSAIALLKYVARKFPDLAPKASFAVAWILDQVKGVTDSSAYDAYASVGEKYPETIYAEAALERIGAKPRQTETRRGEKPRQRETQQPPSQPDTTGQVVLGLPAAPPVKVKGEFIYPEELLSRNLKGEVLFKIKIDISGRVTDYEIIGPSGERSIDSSATACLLQTEFDTSQLSLSQLDQYFQYSIHFERPELDIFYDPYRERREGP